MGSNPAGRTTLPVSAPLSPPPEGTLEAWCWDLIHTPHLEHKLCPPAPPDPRTEEAWELAAVPRRIPRAVRPPCFQSIERSPKTPKPAALRDPKARALLLHTFLHHELQAAELFAWAVLAFPETPRAFRTGLIRLCLEELEHLALYRARLASLGHHAGDFPVRDWFWERVATCETPAAFVALQGLGLEGANLEHSARFAAQFRAAGDSDSAAVLEQVEREEIGHVAFAVQWFERLTGAPLDYRRWREALPEPLSPAVLQGKPINRKARLRAGLDEQFLQCLEAEPSTAIRREA